MDDTVAAILANPDQWKGGTLVNYGLIDSSWPTKLKAAMLQEEGYPRRARIDMIQLEEGRYFSVIGTALDGRADFACLEDIAVLKVNPKPQFPADEAGEIVFRGRAGNVRTRWHEWHLIPKP